LAQPSTLQQNLLARLEHLPITNFHWIFLLTIFIGTAYDFSDQVTLSFVIPEYSKEWGLSPLVTRVHPMLGITGTIIGAFLFGRVADKIGRRNAFLVTLLIFSATSGLNGFAPADPAIGFPWVVMNCFIMGMGVGGEIPLGFTLISEYLPARVRGRAEILIGMLAITGGYIIAAGAAYLFLPYEGMYFGPIPLGWRTIFFISAFPAALAAVIRLYVPESPRYLLSKGKIQEAIRVLRRLGGRAFDGFVGDIFETEGSGPSSGLVVESTRRHRVSDIWRDYLRGRSGLAWTYSWLGQFFVLGFLVWLPTYLARLGYITHEASLYTLIINIIAVPSALLTAFLFERWSTKKTIGLFSVIGGLALVALGISAPHLSPALLIVLGAITMFFAVTVVMGAFPPYVTEIYPTELRGTGSGSAVAFGRTGAVTGIFMGGWILASGLASLALPLTFGLPIIAAGILVALFGIETRRKRLEEISPGVPRSS
jgi:putative MFS transporter